MSSGGNSVFSDFCQAWGARFPGSELPAAWEEDVRANLKKHKTKVAILREELEKEEMYVQYLDKLLADIEEHRSSTTSSSSGSSSKETDNKLTLDLEAAKTKKVEVDDDDDETKDDPFVTVINVNSPTKEAPDLKNLPGSNLTYTKKSTTNEDQKNNKKAPPKPPPKRHLSRESLNSVSSPVTTPTSDPMMTSSTEDFSGSPREALANMTEDDGEEEEEEEEEVEEREENDNEGRGQPDGVDNNESSSAAKLEPPKVNKIKELMANWENKAPIGTKPVEKKRLSATEMKVRKDSIESRGRVASLGGKSHDSSDSENNWQHRKESPGLVRKQRTSGETRLDRLVRRPSSNASDKVPPLPKPRASRRMELPSTSSTASTSNAEPLYDTVANEEPEDEFYDNHLLYGLKSDTMNSGGGSSADLGFEELKSAQSGLSLTGSSSDTDGFSASSPSLQRGVSVDDENAGNYVNIQYFLHFNNGNANNHMDAIQSDDELDKKTKGYFDPEKFVMYKCILNSILDSEAIYLEGLSVMLQYMKAMKVTLSTASPVIPKDDFEIIFYKVPELQDLHLTFHESLKKQVERWNGKDCIGHTFKMLASRTKIYAAFLNNYNKALEALHRCTESYPQFADLTRSIKLRTIKGQKQGQSLSLEDLLHKPVARVQKFCLCLQDLIKYTPENHPDFVTLNEALQTVQNFLNEYNMMHAGELFPHQERPQRHLVKNSFIVELSEGHRKLRHLFLFNDVLVCAKYKASGGNKNEKFTFQLKWYIPLSHALIVEEPSSEPKENSPANLVALKTAASSLRDQIMRIEREEELKGKRNSTGPTKASEKHRKKLAEIEAQLVLASPSLVFQVAHRQGKSYTFFLSSDYERSQWVETLQVLQSSLPTSGPKDNNMSMYELQNWITTCRKFLKTNMGSFLMRSPRDEPLLVGDLHFTVISLQGLTRSSDIYVVVEVDSYGHYFRKSKTKTIAGSVEPVWNEEFIIELEGSENIRILVYDAQGGTAVLRGRATLELSRSWLKSHTAEQRISMNDIVLTCSIRFVTFEETIRRVPNVKPAGLFGTPINILTKKEKRAVPFIITSCVREVERRGIGEVGIYRVSGSAADVTRLKKAFESNSYEAEQLLKDCDIHSVAGILKLFLRDLPESLFTSAIYQKMFESYHITDPETRKMAYLNLFAQIPQNPNQACIVFLVEHMVRVSQYEQVNKMSLHNLATVFGPTMLHAGSERDKKGSRDMLLTTGTVDVMAQAGILHFFLTRRSRNEPIQIVERQV